jgi:hypothetical protein
MEVWLWMVTATIGTANAVVMDNHTTIIIFVIKFPCSLSKGANLAPCYLAMMLNLTSTWWNCFARCYQSFIYFYDKNNNLNLIETK